MINENKLCIDCFFCKTKNDQYYCSMNKFLKGSLEEIVQFTPYDFDCEWWETVDD
jgi:hypothetical protein